MNRRIKPDKKWKAMDKWEKLAHAKKVADAGLAFADLGKKAFGMSDEERAGYAASLANTPPVTKGKSKSASMSVVDPTKDDKIELESGPLVNSAADAEYRKAADKIKKRYG